MTFREQVAKILVTWSMPTRQVAIREIVQLHEKLLQDQKKAILEEYTKKWNKALQRVYCEHCGKFMSREAIKKMEETHD